MAAAVVGAATAGLAGVVRVEGAVMAWAAVARGLVVVAMVLEEATMEVAAVVKGWAEAALVTAVTAVGPMAVEVKVVAAVAAAGMAWVKVVRVWVEAGRA